MSHHTLNRKKIKYCRIVKKGSKAQPNPSQHYHILDIYRGFERGQIDQLISNTAIKENDSTMSKNVKRYHEQHRLEASATPHMKICRSIHRQENNKKLKKQTFRAATQNLI